ncbi:MAG TPA: peptidoglycan-binding protein [Bacillales bacterium]|nr:peptidoglycan-binding protein [Bacillales bacterium]
MNLLGKLKTVLLSTSMVGLMAATPIVTNAAGLGNETLQKGEHGHAVKPLQHQLKNYSYYHDKIDGIFGPHTQKAVSAFQNDYGLDTDGIAGQKTIHTLKQVKSFQHTYRHAPLLDRGDQGKAVKTLQTQLKDLQYYPGDLDGIFGPVTEDAVKSFQKANDLAVDGIAGPHTYKALIHNPVPAKADHKTKVESASTGPAEDNSNQQSTSGNTSDQNVKTITVKSTAYTADCPGCSGVTATGINLNENPDTKVIAVDPDVIPLGSKVWVEGYGYAVAGDVGGGIDGHEIDVYFPSKSKALNWGVHNVKVKVYK